MSTPSILWGSMGPDSHNVDVGLETAVGKTQSLVHEAQSWAGGRGADGSPNYQAFPAAMLQKARDRGSLVVLDWASWDLQNQADAAFALDTILLGNHDAYLHAWATAAAAWGHPFGLRFDWEANGNWYPWGNKPSKYVAAWQYVHDLFARDGATNVSWFWCPNICSANPAAATYFGNLKSLYPGDGYVDWTAIDGYNWGPGHTYPATATTPARTDTWLTFAQVLNGYPGWLGPTYQTIGSIAPGKPMAVCEFACWDDPRKAAWVLDAYATVPSQFPLIRALLYFNWRPPTGVGSQTAAWPPIGLDLAALKLALSSPVYLPAGAWTPPDGLPFGAPPLVVGPALPGQAQQLVAAAALHDTDTASILELEHQAAAAQLALDQAGATLSALQANIRGFIAGAGTP